MLKEVLKSKIQNYLKDFEELFVENELNESKLIDLVCPNGKSSNQELTDKIIERFFEDEEIRKHFFTIKDKYCLFKAQDFKFFFESGKTYNAYTQFKNEIGLAEGNKYLKHSYDVVLNFPFKDCILEGGQSNEDGMDYNIKFDKKGELEETNSKRKEIFFNEIVAKDDIDVLLKPKALTNFESHGDRTGGIEHEKDNLLIKGNNLLALYSLLPIYKGKVKLIYIDPPYNTGKDGFKYNDKFNHSTWLTFMKNRLEVARQLLSDDGVIFVQLDYNEVHYCKILMDEVFGKDNLVREIIWFKGNTFGYAASADNFVLSHDTILFYSKKSNKYQFNKLYEPYSEEYIKKRFTQDDDDGRGKYRIQGQNQRQYLNESKGIPIPDVWQIPVVNVMALERCFDNQKPEQILERIISASTNPGDLVLDFFAGSGTTAAVAHKMGRRWIMIEQMDYIETITKVRMQKVLDGEQGGVSKNQNFQGGGSFCYLELAKWNETAKEKILACGSLEELKTLFSKLYEKYFLNYNLNVKLFFEGQNSQPIIDKDEFKALGIDKQKEIFCNMLDLNQMYVLASEVEDKIYELSKEDIELTKKFYSI